METVQRSVFLLMMICLSSVFVDAQTRQQREQQAAIAIDRELETLYGGRYEGKDVIDIDSVAGNMGLFLEPVEDPYGTLKGCFVFIAGIKGYISYYNNVVGVYKDGRILWHSDTVVVGEHGRLFTTRDLNNDGNVDILTGWKDGGYGPEYLWIFSWDGTTGIRINAVQEGGESVIRGERDAFVLFDAEGDGTLEIKNIGVQDGSLTWSWNGNEYGSWPTTPHLPETTVWPRNKVKVNVKSKVLLMGDLYEYSYIIESHQTSNQRVNAFKVYGKTNNSIITSSPSSWEGGLYYWSTEITDRKGQILPGKTLGGFQIGVDAPPSIVRYYVKGFNDIPRFDDMDSVLLIQAIERGIAENSVWGKTIGPADPPDPFVPVSFLDTLISYKHQAFNLNWIKNQGIMTSFDQKLENTKQQLERGNTQSAKNILEAFVNEVEALNKQENQLTSEAYALLKFNAEYLISKL